MTCSTRTSRTAKPRLAKLDLAYSTLASYRRVINAIWRPAIGPRRFDQVTYSMLVKIADAKQVGKKTYNYIVSVLRRAFEHPSGLGRGAGQLR